MRKALSCIMCMFFIVTATAFAIDKQTSPVKAAKMHATGKVIEISNESIKIERTVKGDVESMEFTLDKSTVGIGINDSVKIEYVEKDGKLVASKVVKVTLKNKEVNPIEVQPVPVKK